MLSRLRAHIAARVTTLAWAACTAVWLGQATLSVGAERHVPDDYPTIQAAIDACADGDQVVIADGEHTGAGNKDLDFHGTLITVRSASDDPQACVIDAGGSGRGFYFHSGESPEAVVQGITVTGGNTVGSPIAHVGGGVLCIGASPTLVRCRIIGNSAGFGGGVFLGQSEAQLINCVIAGNTTANPGGGLAISESDVLLRGCLIHGNSTGFFGAGGGLDVHNLSTAHLENCTITANYATSGGGMWVGYSAVTLTNCIVAGNSAFSPVDGPEIVLSDASGDTLLSVSYSDVFGGQAAIKLHDDNPDYDLTLEWGVGNVPSDPGFIDPDGPDDNPDTWSDNDYHLASASLCRNAGDPDVEYANQSDMDGAPRVLEGRVDIGADEYGDCNANGSPDHQDILDGASRDCQPNGIPDECEPDCNENTVVDNCDDIAAGDYDADGDSDLNDWSFLADVLAGPNVSPGGGAQCAAAIGAAFDRDADFDVDLSDTATFSVSFSPDG